MDYSSSHLAVDVLYAIICVAIWGGAFWYLSPFKNLGEGFGNQDSKFKFEIKKAKDVEQRLNDVKGIDEIRDEINDLINMIKNTS